MENFEEKIEEMLKMTLEELRNLSKEDKKLAIDYLLRNRNFDELFPEVGWEE